MSDLLRITALQADHIATLYSMYCVQTDGLPHNLVPSLERFQIALLGYAQDSILVAEKQGIAQGFAALAHVKDDRGVEADAIVALFTSAPAAGSMLIEEYIARTAPGPLFAFPMTHGQCPVPGYNAAWDGLSAQLPDIADLLIRHGFEPYYREWQMACELDASTPATQQSGGSNQGSITVLNDQPSEVAGVIIRAGVSEEGEFIQRAWVAEELIGMCYYSTLTAITDNPRAGQIGYIQWLWVDSRHRRRGIARELLLRAIIHLKSIGCNVCWLGTGAENWAAQPLYQSFGFTMVDTATSFQYMHNSS